MKPPHDPLTTALLIAAGIVLAATMYLVMAGKTMPPPAVLYRVGRFGYEGCFRPATDAKWMDPIHANDADAWVCVA